MTLQHNERRRFHAAWSDALICFLIFVISLCWCFTFSRIGYDTHHTGLLYKSALDVANGKILFLETYTQYGALTTWIQALFMLIFGKRVTSILLATAVFYAAAFVLLYLLSRRFFGKALSLVATASTVLLAPFYMWDFHPWASVFALTFTLGGLLLLLEVIQALPKKALLCSLSSGVLVAMAFWCRQPAGIVCVLAGVLSLGIPALLFWKNASERKRFVWLTIAFLLGVAVGVFAGLIPILATGAGKDFCIQSFGGMATFVSERSSNGAAGGIGLMLANLFITPAFPGGELPWIVDILWLLLPLSAVGVTVLAVIRLLPSKRSADPANIKKALIHLFYGIFAAGAWHQYYPVGCYRHWYWGAFLCVPALILIAKELISLLFRHPKLASPENREKWCPLAFVLLLAILLVPNAAVRACKGTQKLLATRDMVKMESAYREDLDGLLVTPEMKGYYESLFATVDELQQKLPEKRIVNGTGNGTFGIFDENFHPMFVNWNLAYENFDQILADFVASERPIYIGPEAPQSDYVLYFVPVGDCGDYWATSHRMPANVWVPAEVLPQLQ